MRAAAVLVFFLSSFSDGPSPLVITHMFVGCTVGYLWSLSDAPLWGFLFLLHAVMRCASLSPLYPYYPHSHGATTLINFDAGAFDVCTLCCSALKGYLVSPEGVLVVSLLRLGVRAGRWQRRSH